MPLDLSRPVDAEVYDIICKFPNGVEAKNFLLSAILYYSRSPLVLSANALAESIDKAEGHFRDIMQKLDSAVEKFTQPCNAGGGNVAYSASPEVKSGEAVNVGSSVRKELSSLKEKFKV